VEIGSSSAKNSMFGMIHTATRAPFGQRTFGRRIIGEVG